MSMMSMLIGAGGGADFGDATTTQSNDATYTIGGITYRSHTWLQANQSGNSITFTNSSGNGNVQADVLLIAGGGGGGGVQGTNSNGYGGGGGAGGVIIRSGYNFGLQEYTISVGAGGAGNTQGNSGGTGTNSTIDIANGATILASYGGGGGGWTNDRNSSGSATTKSTPGDGGSTGGAGGGDYGSYTDGGQGFTGGQGHRGGRGTGNVQGDYGGGGGGANAGGADGTDSIGMVNQFDTGTTEGADSRGVGNAYRSGGIAKYAGGGDGWYGGIAGTQYGGGSGNSGGAGGAGGANTGGGGAGGTQGAGGGAGGSGICVIRYPIDIVDQSSDMSQLQSLSAGTHSIATTNGTGSLSLTVVEYNGRKWAKIPWGTETSGGIDGGHWFSNDLFSVHTYGNSNKGISMDTSNRWRNNITCRNTADNNTNTCSSQVIFHFGIRYRYIKVYCTGIQSHTSTGSVVTNCDWGSQHSSPGNFTDDHSGGFGDHPGWIIGWDFNGDEPRYKAISGHTGSAGWIGGSGGWGGGEAGNVTRSFTADIHDCGEDSRGDGLYKHDKAGLLIAGGYAEFYRHNSGYFLIS